MSNNTPILPHAQPELYKSYITTSAAGSGPDGGDTNSLVDICKIMLHHNKKDTAPGKTQHADLRAKIRELAAIQAKSTGGRIALRFMLQRSAAELLPGERVARCLRWIIPGKSAVDVMHSPEVEKAHYKNLVVCGMLWHCPVCAAKISERRRQELSAALADHRYRVFLVTFTLQHDKKDKLADLLEIVTDSYSNKLRHRAWWHGDKKRAGFKNTYGIIGTIRALEVTHGVNGWHVHLHVLMFSDQRKPDSEAMQNELKTQWSAILDRKGRYASFSRGVDLRASSEAVSDYVTKFGLEDFEKADNWTVEHELTKAPAKLARYGGRSPMQLLVDYSGGDSEAGDLWVEYAQVFKGSRHLVWSRGLRQLLGLGEDQTDEELAEEDQESAVLLISIARKYWRIVLANDARAELITIAGAGDKSAVIQFLHEIGAFDDSDPDGEYDDIRQSLRTRLNQLAHDPDDIYSRFG